MRGGTHLYVIQMAVTGDFKVGRSADVTRRLGELQTACPQRLRVLLVAQDKGDEERRVHRALERFSVRYGGAEWFQEAGFGAIPDDIYELFSEAVLDDSDWWRET